MQNEKLIINSILTDALTIRPIISNYGVFEEHQFGALQIVRWFVQLWLQSEETDCYTKLATLYIYDWTKLFKTVVFSKPIEFCVATSWTFFCIMIWELYTLDCFWSLFLLVELRKHFLVDLQKYHLLFRHWCGMLKSWDRLHCGLLLLVKTKFHLSKILCGHSPLLAIAECGQFLIFFSFFFLFGFQAKELRVCSSKRLWLLYWCRYQIKLCWSHIEPLGTSILWDISSRRWQNEYR